jgi:branched-chain amino acid transport system substrate-binding protein
LNRARIHDALADIEQYDGVTGHMVFDPNQKNVAPMFLGTVHDGAITYRLATMEKQSTVQRALAAQAASAAPQVLAQATSAAPQVPAALQVPQVPYARVGEDGVGFAGPHRASWPAGPVRVVLFGPNAAEIAHSPEILAELRAGTANQRAWTMLPVESAQNWGAASPQLVRALMDEHALAIIAIERDAGHLSEQLALKCFVPVVALSNDRSLTSANIPWIFRMPAGATPAGALHLLKEAVARGAASPEQVRDVLASGSAVSGMAFQPTGGPRER